MVANALARLRTWRSVDPAHRTFVIVESPNFAGVTLMTECGWYASAENESAEVAFTFALAEWEEKYGDY